MMKIRKRILPHKTGDHRLRLWSLSPCSLSALCLGVILFWAGLGIASPLEVFVSIPPQKYLLDQLGGELVESHVLVGQGQSPHLFHPTSKQIMALSRAKLFFSIDMEFEHILIAKLEQPTSSLQLVDSVRSIRKIPLQQGSHEHDGHEILDPHVWLSPANLKIMAANMAEALIAADSSHKQIYAKNLGKLQRELDSVDTDIRNAFAPFAGASFYVFHPAFGYLAHTYNLQQQAVEVDGKSPTPRQLSAFMAKAKKEQIKVVFVQAEFDSRSAEAVAQAIGAKVVALNPLAEDVTASIRSMANEILKSLTP